MENKVVLVLVDGMRPDAIEKCGNPYLLELAKEGTSCLKSTTIMPSWTLPCHSSLFYGVNADRHGNTSNVWHPLARPIDSLIDVAHAGRKKTAMFYNWEPLRDMSRPESLDASFYARIKNENGNIALTDLAIQYINAENPDFVFLYLGYTDEAGHHYGWMSDEYLSSVASASKAIEKLKNSISDEYNIVVTADHGGHERTHGSDCKEDMTIPIIFNGKAFEKGKKLPELNIKDIAPTVADVLSLEKPREWEGKSIF